jgi:ubiquinone/menaquinone biosynthesis C-methylase UbiE
LSPDTGYIHGGTDSVEVARLEKQARFASSFILRDFTAAPGERVLDLATGVGAMAAQLAERFPGIRLFGLDLNAAQLWTARSRHAVAAYVQGDGAHLPFRDGSFHHVHCSWLLEHVRRPLEVLVEVRRVLCTGGTCHFTEVDNASFRTEPAYAEVTRTMDELNRAQLAAGGDPYVGGKLGALLSQASFSKVQVRPAGLVGTAEDPNRYREFAEEFAEIFESLDEALGKTLGDTLHAAAARLRALPSIPGSRMEYCSFIGRGTR